MRSGNVVSILEVDGSQTAERLIEELQNRTEDKLNNKMLLAATFAAVDDDQQSTVEHTIARATATVSPLAEKPMPEYRLQSEGAAVLFDSLWAGAPGPSSRTATVDLQAGLSRGVLYSRFGNVYSDIMTGLHRYSELSAQRIPMGPLHVSYVHHSSICRHVVDQCHI